MCITLAFGTRRVENGDNIIKKEELGVKGEEDLSVSFDMDDDLEITEVLMISLLILVLIDNYFPIHFLSVIGTESNVFSGFLCYTLVLLCNCCFVNCTFYWIYV